jgi:hypothetical protein
LNVAVGAIAYEKGKIDYIALQCKSLK